MPSKRFLFLTIFFSITAIIGIAGYLYFTNQKPALAAGSTINAVSCNRADVQAAVNSASAGDTVIVPAGNCTWASALTITKGLTLRGAGIGQTIITSPATIIQINPDATAIADDNIIKVDGFTLDGNNRALTIITVRGAGATSSKPFKNLVISNNKLQNALNVTSGSGCISTTGQVRGVISSNTFDRCNVLFKVMGNDSQTEWTNKNFPATYGTSDNLYIEDNTVLWSSSYSGGDPGWTESGQGGRTVLRYNKFAYANALSLTESHDVHGFQNWPSNGQTGTMVVEFYGNTYTDAKAWRWFTHRGGQGLIFNNIATGTGGMAIEINQYAVGDTGGSGCNSESGLFAYGINGEVNNTYVFNNTQNGTVKNMTPGGIIGDGCSVSEANGSYRNYNSSCTSSSCTSSIGRGTIPPTGTCTTGVGYWVSSTPTPTSSSSVIQNSTLYKCTATNTWTAYYTPYTYPHPLTLGSTPPPVSNFYPNQIIEAESGQISAPMQTGVSGLDTYVYTPSINNTGSVRFNFNISQAGQYKMEAKVNSDNDAGQNSFYVGLDNESAQNNILYSYNIFPLATGFVWDEVSKWGNGQTGNPPISEFDPMTWNLNQGTYSFTFYGRESNTWLDQIRLVPVTTDITPPSAPTGLIVN